MIYQILGAEMIKSTLFTAYILNLRWEPPLVNQTTIKNPRFLYRTMLWPPPNSVGGKK